MYAAADDKLDGPSGSSSQTAGHEVQYVFARVKDWVSAKALLGPFEEVPVNLLSGLLCGQI